MINIILPIEMNTSIKKWRWAHRFDNRLTALHNWVGEWYTTGKTQNQYNNVLPTLIKNKISYVPKLSKRKWDIFVEWHHKLTQQIHKIIHENRPVLPNQSMSDIHIILLEVEDAKNDNTLIVDIDSNVEEV